MPLPEWMTPEAMTAVGVLLGTAITVATTKGRAKKPSEPAPTTAPHQEIVRPATDAERRQADAMEDIAASVDRIERTLEAYMRGRR
jgi:hypothetical protein